LSRKRNSVLSEHHLKMPTPSTVNIEKLAALIRAKRGVRGLRSIAAEISGIASPVSASTLSRVEQGNVPDLETFMSLCRWLNVSSDDFRECATGSSSEVVAPRPAAEIIEAHLRADRTLPAEAIEALSRMIRFAYSATREGNLVKHTDP
jgi:transcriptional regulator with XRE-family HTH domain